ncbi:hypothetical protein Pmani_019410 [Petrolisthes manimaculis]|uniref:Uncharacterized protein n=1 Tax=Petrolisthes manimaculis TaxID=1843537 RepID=A0AAE1U7E8_9EUCA|nr:hypothetical protein Pmani_019410 [Petrolisthes manimaculis]
MDSLNSFVSTDLQDVGLLSSGAEHWSCKPGVVSSILTGGISCLADTFAKRVMSAAYYTRLQYKNREYNGSVELDTADGLVTALDTSYGGKGLMLTQLDC